jgi:hypothetical protein
MDDNRGLFCLIHRLSYKPESLAYSGRNRTALLRIFFFPYEKQCCKMAFIDERGALAYSKRMLLHMLPGPRKPHRP